MGREGKDQESWLVGVIYTSLQWSGARHQPGHLRVMAGEGRTHFLRGILFKAAFPCTVAGR